MNKLIVNINKCILYSLLILDENLCDVFWKLNWFLNLKCGFLVILFLFDIFLSFLYLNYIEIKIIKCFGEIFEMKYVWFFLLFCVLIWIWIFYVC